MADTLTTQIIQDGGRTAIIRGNVAVGNTDVTGFGIPNPGIFGTAGNTGDIVATTVSPTGGDTYSFIVTVTKLYASV